MEHFHALLLTFLEMTFIFVGLGMLYSQRRAIGKAPFYMALGLLFLFSHFVSAAEIRTVLFGTIDFEVGRIVIFLPSRMEKSVVIVIKPMPPTWMSARITACPNVLQYESVSSTTRPVTHAALVAVNSAVSGGAPLPDAVAAGSIKSTLPTAIMMRKPSTSMRVGFRLRRAVSAGPVSF